MDETGCPLNTLSIAKLKSLHYVSQIFVRLHDFVYWYLTKIRSADATFQ